MLWDREYSLPWVTMADDGNIEPGGASGGDPPQDTDAAPNQASEAPVAPEAPSEPAQDTQRVEIPLYARKMMDRFHSKAEQAEAQLAEARAELELLRRQQATAAAQPVAPGAQPNPQPAHRPDDGYIEERIAQGMAQKQWQLDIAQAEEQGLRIHGENWSNIISNLNAMGGFRNSQKDLAFIIQTGKAPQIMAELAKVQNGSPLYEQVMAIPNEAKRFARLLELGSAQAPAASAAPARPASSNAPPPIDPVTGRGTHAPPPNDLYDPKMTDDRYDADWYAIRLEQKRQKYQRQNAR